KDSSHRSSRPDGCLRRGERSGEQPTSLFGFFPAVARSAAGFHVEEQKAPASLPADETGMPAGGQVYRRATTSSRLRQLGFGGNIQIRLVQPPPGIGSAVPALQRDRAHVLAFFLVQNLEERSIQTAPHLRR